MTAPPLRIGVILDSLVLERWQAGVIEGICATPDSILAAVLLPESGGDASRASRGRQSALLTFFRKVECVLLARRAGRPDPLAPQTAEGCFGDAVRLFVRSSVSDGVRQLDAASVESVSGRSLDVLLDFSSIPLGAPIPRITHGVWRYRHGVATTDSAVPPYLPELLGGVTTAEARLQVQTDESPVGRVVDRGVWHVYPLSLYINQVRAFTKGAALVTDALARIRDGDDVFFKPTVAAESPKQTYSRVSSAGLLVRAMGVLGRRIARRAAYRLRYHEQWLIYVRHRGSAPPWASEFRGVPLLPPARRFYADPFLFSRDGETYLFFEDYPFDTGKGVISYVRLDREGNPSPVALALECGYHLSYPFIFEHDGAVYMIPESVATRKVELFRAVEFPDNWIPQCVLLDDIDAVDSTLFEHGGRFWLLLGRFHPGFSEADELWGFWSHSPFGPWTPHRRNPLMRDVRRSRPAGSAFLEGGALILPVQDGALRYGHRIRFLRIDRLTPTEWAWTEVGQIDPDSIPGNQATHTYNRNEDFEVVDAQVLASRYSSSTNR